MPKNCSNASATCAGLIPGFRVWTLKAFDENGQCIVEVSEDMGSNNRKYKRFCELIDAKGYQLTASQAQELSATLYLNLNWDNSNVSFKQYAQMI